MIVNDTKKTLPAIRIALSYGDEQGFEALQKVINLIRFAKINAIFEIFDLAGENYQKGLPYGIAEADLVRLSKCNVLLHTPYNYTFFNKNRHFEMDKYLNIALEQFVDENGFGTNYYKKNEKFLTNKDEYKKLEQKTNFKSTFGEHIFTMQLDKYDDLSILNFCKDLFNILEIHNFDEILSKNKTIENTIKELKTIAKEFLAVDIKNFLPEPKIDLKNVELPLKITKKETKLKGFYKVSELVEHIKNKVEMPEGFCLKMIVSFDVEVYPNIAFWDKTILDPIIILQKDIRPQTCY